VPDAPKLLTPWVESPFFARELEARRDHLSAADIALATTYHDQGYVALAQAVDHELCDRIRAEVEPMFDESYAIEHRRVPDAWQRGALSVLELARLQPVQDTLAMLYGRRPIPFQTLNFKLGTQQALHSDAIHFTCLPARFMCGVWVALEDVDEGNGPLLYYPGSHRLSHFEPHELGLSDADLRYDRHEAVWLELMAERGIEPVEFHARKGDVLIWSSDILHGGKRVEREGSTRWSQVTHFYFADCLYYAPIYSDLFTGELRLKDITDLNTMEPVTHTYDGEPLTITPSVNERSRLALTRLASGTSSNGSVAPDLEAQLAEARHEAVALRRSASYRLGHSLLAPVRAVRRRPG
jgi:hypothetical protein